MFDAKRFLRDNFGTSDRLIALVSAYGLATPQDGAVRKWLQRGSVSGAWLPVLLVVLELENGGAPVSLAQYFGRGRK